MRRMAGVWEAAGLAAALIYLTAHTFLGEAGLLNALKLEARVRALSAEAQALEVRQAALREEISRLSPGSLDLDYLEERARSDLGARRGDEIVLAAPG